MNKKMLINFSDDSPALEVSAHATEADRDWVHFYDAEGELVASIPSRHIRHITTSEPNTPALGFLVVGEDVTFRLRGPGSDVFTARSDAQAEADKRNAYATALGSPADHRVTEIVEPTA